MMNFIIALFEGGHFLARKRKLLLFGQTLRDIVEQARELCLIYIRSVESGKLARRLADAFAVSSTFASAARYSSKSSS